MENPIPEIEEFIGSDVTEGEFKVALNKLLMYLSESVGDDGENYLEKSGGTMTGDITFASTQTLPVDIQQDNQAVISGEYIYVGATLLSSQSQKTTLNIDISQYIPDDGYVYGLYLTAYVSTSTTSNQISCCAIQTEITTNQLIVGRGRSVNSISVTNGGSAIVPVGTDRILTVNGQDNWYGKTDLNLICIQRLYKE